MIRKGVGIILAIVALLLALASPLPIWPGPMLIRHIPPGIISFILLLSAYFAVRKEGSRAVGIIAMIYGFLAILAGGLFISLVLISTNPEFLLATGRIITLGSTLALIVGIIAFLLGYRLFKKAK